MNIKKTTVLMAAVLAAATVLTAGLAVLPNSVQDAQANPCGNIVNTPSQSPGDPQIVCKIIGPVDVDE
jgi:hypothetical protein